MDKPSIALITILSLLPSNLARAESSIGVGAGIPYGFIGFNVNYAISEKLDLTLGLGETVFAGSGKAIGLRYYPNPGDSGLRYSLIYGTNVIIQEDDCFLIVFCDGDSSYEGYNLGVGWSSRDAAGGWDVDLIVILTSEAEDRIDELQSRGDSIDDIDLPDLKISIGYHWR